MRNCRTCRRRLNDSADESCVMCSFGVTNRHYGATFQVVRATYRGRVGLRWNARCEAANSWPLTPLVAAY